MKWTTGLLWVSLSAACVTDPFAVDAMRFSCSKDADCVEGQRCILGECARQNSIEADAGGHDGGLDAGCVPRIETTEECDNGVDDDCDGLIDCADPDCAQSACRSGSTSSICCSGQCVDLSASSSNCGNCGISCNQGCTAYSAGGIESGRCRCINDNQCPSGQVCSSGSCTCDSNSDCRAGGVCSLTEGISGPGFCHL